LTPDAARHEAARSPESDRRGFFVRYWLPVLLYLGLIFSFSSIHGTAVPDFFPNVDKLEHLLEYSLFGLLAGRAIRFTLGQTKHRMAAALATIAFGALVGALDELYQAGVPGRNSDPRDWMMDVAAVSIAVLLTQLVRTRSIDTPANGGATSR
jgi:VanZ family protein